MGIFGSKNTGKAEQRSIDTVIGGEAVFEGTLTTKNSVCVEGVFRGKLQSEGAVILSRSGSIEADVVAGYVAVNGTLRGNVRALQQLDVGETGVIHGDVQAVAVTVAKGGVLDGTCHMMEAEARAEPAPALAASRTPATVGTLHRKRGERTSPVEEPVLAAEA
jgi:cytoskeletal protein CcmA (bactofilin family)